MLCSTTSLPPLPPLLTYLSFSVQGLCGGPCPRPCGDGAGNFAAPRHGLRRGHRDGLRPSHARVHGESLGLVFAAEVGEVAAAEAAAAEAAAAVEAVAAAEAAAAVESAAAADRAASKAAADAPGAEAALSPELPKEPGGGADGMAEDAEEIPGRPEELKTRGGSLSS